MQFYDLWRRFVGTPPAGKGFVSNPQAKRVLARAGAVAARAGRRTASVSDVAEAVLGLDEGCTRAVLQRLAIDPAQLRHALAAEPDHADFEELLPLADRERRTLGHLSVGAEHLLLATMTRAGTALTRKCGFEISAMRDEIVRQLDPNYTPAFGAPSLTAPDPGNE